MKKVTSILFLLLLCFPAFSQDGGKTEQRSDRIKIYFDHSSHAINLDLKHNRESLSHFSNLIEKLNSDTLSVITKIEINSYTSPEEGRTYNEKLSEKRSNAIYDYLIKTNSVPDSLIDKKYSGTDWDMLQTLVEESDMEYKDKVLYILKNVPEETWRRVNPNDRWLSLVDSRNKHLMDLKYGNPYRWMFANIYPELRNGSVVTIYFKRELPPVIETEVEVAVVEEVEPITETEPVVEEPVVEEPSEPIIKPLLAIKTNLLYDVASLTNIELEVPIGKRWSVAGEWIFPWWKSNKADWTTQLLSGHLTAKYWFGDRDNVDVLTGWYLGLNGGASKYDFQIFNNDGIQGEAFDVGLQAGYAHTINKRGNLRLEYSLGVGYLQSDYKKYVKTQGTDFGDIKVFNYPWETNRLMWIGPTSAKVSLVWLLNYKSTKQKGE